MTMLDSLFSRAPRRNAAEFDPDIGEDIVAAYCQALEESAPLPGCVADVEELPYPKETIKEALRWRLQRTSDVDYRDTLKVAYVALADWQPGVGPRHRGLDLTQLPPDLSRQQRLERIAEQALEGAAWSARSNAEAEQLHRELVALGV
jgi:hypothetical protein